MSTLNSAPIAGESIQPMESLRSLGLRVTYKNRALFSELRNNRLGSGNEAKNSDTITIRSNKFIFSLPKNGLIEGAKYGINIMLPATDKESVSAIFFESHFHQNKQMKILIGNKQESENLMNQYFEYLDTESQNITTPISVSIEVEKTPGVVRRIASRVGVGLLNLAHKRTARSTEKKAQKILDQNK